MQFVAILCPRLVAELVCERVKRVQPPDIHKKRRRIAITLIDHTEQARIEIERPLLRWNIASGVEGLLGIRVVAC